MFGNAPLNEKIYKIVILILKILVTASSFGLSAFLSIAFIKDFEHDSAARVMYVACIYIAMISIEKMFEFIHNIQQNKSDD